MQLELMLALYNLRPQIRKELIMWLISTLVTTCFREK